MAHKADCRPPPTGKVGAAAADSAYGAAVSRGGEAGGEARSARSQRDGETETGTTTTLTYSTVVNMAGPGDAPRY